LNYYYNQATNAQPFLFVLVFVFVFVFVFVNRLLDYLKPKVEELAKKLDGVINENDIVRFIQETTLVGVIPQPHPIVVRAYQPNKYTSLWFTTFLWGVIFMRNQIIPLWDGSTVEIFTLMQSENVGDNSGNKGGDIDRRTRTV
jgi:hypothetical protein